MEHDILFLLILYNYSFMFREHSGYKEWRDAWGFTPEKQKGVVKWLCISRKREFAGCWQLESVPLSLSLSYSYI